MAARDHSTVVHVGVKGEAARALRQVFSRHGAATFVFAADAIGHGRGRRARRTSTT